MGIFKMKFIKRSARALQEKWLLAALAYEDPKKLSDEVLHLCQMAAHAMEIKDEQDAFRVIEKAKLEWKVMCDMMDEVYGKQKSTTKRKTKTAPKATRKASSSVGTRKRSTPTRHKTPKARAGNRSKE